MLSPSTFNGGNAKTYIYQGNGVHIQEGLVILFQSNRFGNHLVQNIIVITAEVSNKVNASPQIHLDRITPPS